MGRVRCKTYQLIFVSFQKIIEYGASRRTIHYCPRRTEKRGDCHSERSEESSILEILRSFHSLRRRPERSRRNDKFVGLFRDLAVYEKKVITSTPRPSCGHFTPRPAKNKCMEINLLHP